ncbi:hypothetical protein [Bacillus halotolerans]|nr:hypothetical protein [Bacillus halotolerans]QNS20800.1 hypothetical protein ICJ61_02805 [Bacillus halotolerans]
MNRRKADGHRIPSAFSVKTHSMCFVCLKEMTAGIQQPTPIKGGIQNGTR